MSNKNKRRPARPHYERITRRNPNGAETLVPQSENRYFGYTEFKRGSTKRTPGQ